MTVLRKLNAKRDANEPDIVRAFIGLGCLVYRLDKPFDLLVFVPKAKYDRMILVEVKMPGRRMNANQMQTCANGWPVAVVHSVDEVINLVKVIVQADALEDAA